MTSRLSTETLQQLGPLLGGLARLIVLDSRLSDRELRTLLLGAGLESETGALEELKRWGRLLQELRAEADEAARLATSEALQARGLLEAPVLLAISAVCKGQETQPLLKTSVSNLDLGELRLGESATTKFEVQGAPGQVEVESDYVHVEPGSFGPDVTSIKVSIEPFNSPTLLRTSLRFLTRAGILEIPLCAQWIEEAGASQGDGSSGEYEKDGVSSGVEVSIGLSISRDQETVVKPGITMRSAAGPGVVVAVDNLLQAIEDAPPGARLHLKAGMYEIGQTLAITKALSFIGDGIDATIISSSADDCIINCGASGTIEFSNLTIRRSEETAGDILWCGQGELRMSQCRVSGARRKGEARGDGIHIYGEGKGLISKCILDDNQDAGLVVSHGQFEIAHSTLTRNSRGIALWGDASGTAKGNTCKNNWAGIYVVGEACPFLVGNACEGNRGSGIVFGGEASGLCEQNTCSENGQSGISLIGSASPRLDSNICRGNQEEGIHYNGKPGGNATNNTCAENRRHGIHVYHQAAPELRSNSCKGNALDGIYFETHAGGVAAGNTCWSNGRHGISTSEMTPSSPSIEDNSCCQNVQCGILLSHHCSSLVQRNNCGANGQDGIRVEHGGSPTLRENRCGRHAETQSSTTTEGNKGSGIAFYLGDGRAERNECLGNAGSGISVEVGWSHLHLEGNTCKLNSRAGLWFRGSSQGVGKDNLCEDNTGDGIQVSGSAEPLLEGNRCHRNAVGIAIEDTATGSVVGNTCHANGIGLIIGSKARPVLKDNTIQENKDTDIKDERPWTARVVLGK